MSKMVSQNDDGFLDFSFCVDYIHKCQYYFKLICDDMIFHILSISKVSKKTFKEIFNAINNVMNVRNLYNINKSLSYFILLNPSKRYITLNKPIESKNVNGAFTFINSNNIFIIRKQELGKVVIHELLHHNNKIHLHNWKEQNINMLKRNFEINYQCKLYPNEAIIEAFACLLMCCFISIQRKIPFKTVYYKEMIHSQKMANVILNMQNDKEWYEKTNAFCYIVFKCILFCKFNDFMKIFHYGKYNDTFITDFIIKNQIKRTGVKANTKTISFTYYKL